MAVLKRIRDALENALTGFGTHRAKIAAGVYAPDPILSPAELETLFADNDLAHTIVAKIVEDALRAGFDLERDGAAEADRELAAKILARLTELDVRGALERGGTFGRLFGGAGSILGVRGAGPLATPLPDGMGRLEMLVDFDRQDLTAQTWLPDGRVETYMWMRPAYGTQAFPPQIVHSSRVLMFPGAMTTQRRRHQNQGWDLSVLQRVFQVLRSFDSMFASVDAMFADASQAVFKIQGLIQSLAEANGTGEQTVETRLQLMDLLRSTAKAIVLDAGDETGTAAESFDVVDRKSLPGLDGVMVQYYVRLCTAARYPLTVLLGTAPQGMNATGESDLLLYFNTVDVYRQSVLTPRLLRLVRMVARDLGDARPETWCVKWPELQRPKPLDVSTLEKMKVDAAIALVNAGVALPEEVALSLRKVTPTLGLSVDLDVRKAALAQALLELEQGTYEPPAGEPPAENMSERKTPAQAAGQQT